MHVHCDLLGHLVLHPIYVASPLGTMPSRMTCSFASACNNRMQTPMILLASSRCICGDCMQSHSYQHARQCNATTVTVRVAGHLLLRATDIFVAVAGLQL